MNSNQNFALEQLESRIEMHCGWHLHLYKRCVYIGFIKICWYEPRWYWYCN